MPIEKISFLEKMSDAGIWTWIFLIVTITLGATVRYVKTLKQKPFKLMNLVIELVVSAFVAIMAGLICAAMEIDYIWSFAIIGMSSHQATRALYLIQNLVNKKLEM